MKENNQRDRILTDEEFSRLLDNSSPHLRPILQLAYHTGMRQGEILGLTWDMLNLREGFIHLHPEHTRTNESRDVPLNPELVEMFQAMSMGLPGITVFLRDGKQIKSIREAFEAACKRAEIKDFVFHDLRHTFTTNMRRAGVHDLLIMAITGHKTLAMFQRYNTVSKEELKAAVNGKSE